MSEENKMNFWQGQANLLCDNNQKEGDQNNNLKKIKEKIAEFSNIKNINFLLGAGASSGAIPTMEEMKESLIKEKESQSFAELYEKFLNDDVNNKGKDNLEHLLSVMYAKQYYQKNIQTQTSDDTQNIDDLIKYIENHIYKKINIDMSNECQKIIDKLKLYKDFYQKIVLRNKDLARVNIFTTNNDLFNEKALDDLNINYNNGFGGGLERVFNPARFRYTFSQKIDANLEKFEPLENMVYLYKLHGSISWIEKEGNSLFNIQEIAVKGGGQDNQQENNVLIYPTPLKQWQSLASPYSDLIREFQTKLCQSNSVLFVIGYSFSDEHINNIIYQSLTSNASLSIVIFGEYNQCPLTKIGDSRIYRIFSKDEENKKNKIHYFEYIVKNLLPDLDENKEKNLLDTFFKNLKEQNKNQ